VDTVFFEAPRKDQQAWFIRELGPEVNLANIALDEALALETLRLGLRADTCDVHARSVTA
jgi:phosphosulfolactate synthase